ncbi:MAG: prepilin-type N-terminal cleavage/methylation domain-containing protein [Planctomycetota bacterium]|nr:prepilin-type N-terminal cleavage/methylation domain-containing protein [Planctomycetota bacterium]
MIRPATTSRPAASGPRGFTLIEVLVTMALLAVVVPAAMQGMSLCLDTGDRARLREQACSLAQGKLAELCAAGQFQQANVQGDFGSDWPKYRWQAAVSSYDATLRQISVTVSWDRSGCEYALTLTSLVYPTGGTTP